MINRYNYTLCGWHTSTDIPLTGVPAVQSHGKDVDVLVEIAPGQSPIADVEEWLDTADCSLIRMKGVADFEVSGGRRIRIWPAVGTTLKDIELCLFGAVWGALCHQRGTLPLHASAVIAKGAITAFAGPSGAGKSTTAALMASHGYEIFADDILPISFNGNSVPGAWPFLRRLKVSLDLISELGLSAIEPVSPRFDRDKYFFSPAYVGKDAWRRIERIFLLDVDPDISGVSIDRITGGEAVRALVDQTYRWDCVFEAGQVGHHLHSITRLISKVSVFRLRRSPDLALRKELVSAISAHV